MKKKQEGKSVDKNKQQRAAAGDGGAVGESGASVEIEGASSEAAEEAIAADAEVATTTDASAAAEPVAESVEGAAEEVGTELEALRQELEATKDRLLRLTAEFDNYRKRTLRERSELISQASGRTLEALLPVVDDFDRAIASSKESQSLPSMLEGLELIHKSLYGFLKREGIEEIAAVGLELDTDVHDAVAKAPAPEEKLRGKIVDVVRKGYKLRGVVLRHAQVVVGE